jgi:hypothetical protein
MSRQSYYMGEDDREQKLPIWAQDKLRYLRANVQVLEEKLAEVPLTEDTLVVTDRYDKHPNPVKLGRRDDVTFFLRRYDGPDWFDVRVEGDALLIHGTESLQTHQRSANVVELTFVRGLQEDRVAQYHEAVTKGWSAEEIRLNKHLGHIPHRNDLVGRTQAEIEDGR